MLCNYRQFNVQSIYTICSNFKFRNAKHIAIKLIKIMHIHRNKLYIFEYLHTALAILLKAKINKSVLMNFGSTFNYVNILPNMQFAALKTNKISVCPHRQRAHSLDYRNVFFSRLQEMANERQRKLICKYFRAPSFFLQFMIETQP